MEKSTNKKAKKKNEEKTSIDDLPGTENIKYKLKDNKLFLEIDLSYRGKSTEKGNIRICSSLGNKGIPNTGGIILGLNIYTR